MPLVRHIVALRYADGFTPEENKKNAQKVKTELESLKNIIPGIVEFKVITDALPSSNMDIVFNTLFESADTLAAYQVHPEHVRVAAYVRSVMRDRSCIDYYEG
ncbi:MAG: Dabb family protein [Planctomycetaceae bacterium]|nr:Dabb family protein [Planctomycetaceae bacterium]